jgi:hypothetical protein
LRGLRRLTFWFLHNTWVPVCYVKDKITKKSLYKTLKLYKLYKYLLTSPKGRAIINYITENLIGAPNAKTARYGGEVVLKDRNGAR